MPTALLLLPLLAVPSVAPAAQAAKVSPPPGLVLIEGGKTKIGSDPKAIEKLILEEPEAEERARSLLGETPQHTLEVAPFFLMVTEVTNEQYRAFVEATGARPPEHWGQPAILEAQKLFVAEQGKLRQEMKERGEKLPDAGTFQPQQWWLHNWKAAEWAVPAGQELFPVRFVSYEDALTYARWAGLRLMSEEEFQRAVRDDSERLFPWGEAFDAKLAVTSEDVRRGEPLRVATRPDGANEVGVHDLIGNVWEWTTTPYSAYKGYEPLEVKLDKGKRKVRVESPWDPDLRVIVGGSYQSTSALACRATVRRRTERSQTTEAVGFRCAGSILPGLDLARAVLDHDLPLRVRPDGEEGKVKYRVEGTAAIDRWKAKSAAPTVAKVEADDDETSAREAGAPKAEDAPPAGYALIEGYEYVVFIPAEIVRSANVSDLRKSSVEADSTPIGVLKTTFPLLEPALPAGTYMISFRGAGETHAKKTPAAAPAEGEAPAPEGAVVEAAPVATLKERIGLDVEQDTFVFFNDSGEPVTFMPAATWDHVRTSPGTLQVVDVELTSTNEAGEEVKWTEKRLNLEAMVDSLVSSKGYRFTIPLKLEKDVLEQAWR